MKRFALPLFALLAVASAAAEVTLPDGTLRYDVAYHCGFIKISAGEADIDLNLDNDQFTATLNGQTEPIGGRIYAISDTLRASMQPADKGLSKEIVTYENGWYTKPKVENLDGSAISFSNPRDYKNIYGDGDLSASSETMEAVTITADMLAMFYYFQQMDFSTIRPGDDISLAVTLPDGDIQQVNIVYEGTDCYKERQTYKLSLNYSYHGEMSNYPVTVQVDTESRLPLLFSADIKIGHVEMALK
ncbi:MAG: DUF3108 domain-containing protein [Muribaculaceae bacterium]|nr:DUF3108 domain-containing protein [Muribaculaceae bacterium]